MSLQREHRGSGVMVVSSSNLHISLFFRTLNAIADHAAKHF